MIGINEYLVSVVGACALGIVADLLTVSSLKNKGNTEKYVKLGVTLCLISIILLPMLSAVDTGEIFNRMHIADYYEDVPSADSLYIIERECEEKTSEYIFEKTGIKPIAVSIKIVMNSGKEIVVESAEVKIRDYTAEEAEKVRVAAAEAVGTEVSIICGEGNVGDT